VADHRFGFVGSGAASADEAIGLAVRAEKAGFGTFVLSDLPWALSPAVVLAAVARAPTRIGVGTFVLNAGWWDPATVVTDATGVGLRCGAGGIRGRLSIRRIVDAPTRYPRPSSSPWIRL
jgi:hypothetical protein